MAKYAQLVATGLPPGVLITIKNSSGNQVSDLFPSANATAPDNRARYADGNGVLSPATYLPNGTYTVAYSGGSSSVVVSGASGLPAATPFDMATQDELDDQASDAAGTFPPRAGGSTGSAAPVPFFNAADYATVQAALDAAAGASALVSHAKVVVPAGTYELTAGLTNGRANLTLQLSPNTTLKAMTDGMTLFTSNGYDNVTVDGQGATFDLNDLGNCGVNLRGTSDGARATGLTVRDLSVNSRPVNDAASTGKSAIEFRYADRVRGYNLAVSDFSYDAVDSRYAIGTFNSSDIKISDVSISNCRIGFECNANTDYQVDRFTIDTLTDNGFYLDGGSTDVRITNGLIIAAEEGVVVAGDRHTITNVEFRNCTNKGVSLRSGTHTKITGCHFTGNPNAIGDNGSGVAVTRAIISNNTFYNNTGTRAIYLIALSDSDITGNRFYETLLTAGDYMIRLNNAARVRVTNNTFNNPDKTINGIRLSHGSTNNDVLFNLFTACATAINMFTSGSSPTGTIVGLNVFRDVTTQIVTSPSVTYSYYPLPDATTEAVSTTAASGAALTLADYVPMHNVTLTANCTLTFPTIAAGRSFTLRLTQDGTGSRTVTWPAGLKWGVGVPPTLSTGAGKQDWLTFSSMDGSAWTGFLAVLDAR